MKSINNFPSLAFKNKSLIQSGNEVGCFHCVKIFDKAEIKNYTDNELTAICPYCQTDAIVSDNCEFSLDLEILEKAKKFWLKN